VSSGGDLRRVRQHHADALRDYRGRHRRGRADTLNEMARIRVSRQAGSSKPIAAPNCAVSLASGLADVVRGNVGILRTPVVRTFHRQAAGGRSGYAQLAESESVSESAAALRARRAIRVSVHDARRAQNDWIMVEPQTGGQIFSGDLAR